MNGHLNNYSPYQISCSKEQFEQLKTDDRFLYLLMLGRVINSLRFCHKAGIDAKEDLTPGGARARMNSFFFAASVLYEGFRLIERMGRSFKDTASYQSGFKPLLRDHKVNELRDKVLKRVRNKVVFHFDERGARESLANFELPEYVFAAGVGEASGEMVFQLSEEVVINYLLRPGPTDNDHTLKQRYEEIIDQALEITGRFIEASERLMGEVLGDMGFKTKQMPFTEANEGKQGTEVGCRRSDVRGRKDGGEGQRADVGGQMSEGGKTERLRDLGTKGLRD